MAPSLRRPSTNARERAVEAHCKVRCRISRCIAVIARRDGRTSRCCLCTHHPSRRCHHHRNRKDLATIERRSLDKLATIGNGVEVRRSEYLAKVAPGVEYPRGIFATWSFEPGDPITFYEGQTMRGPARSSDVSRAIREEDKTHMIFIRGTGDHSVIIGLKHPLPKGAGGASMSNSARGSLVNTQMVVEQSRTISLPVHQEYDRMFNPRDRSHSKRRDVPMMVLYATKRIRPGDELLWHYPVIG